MRRFTRLRGPAFAALLILALTAPLSAQAQSALTLDQATALALDRHPDLAPARRGIEAAQGAAVQAGALPNPELAFTLEDTRRETRTTAVQVHQRLELGGQRGARLAVARRAQDAAQAQLDARIATIRAQVRASFWEAVAAQTRLDLARESTQLAQQAVDAAAKRVAAGKVSPVDETRARLALSGVALEMAQAQADWLSTKAHLAAQWGGPAASVTALSGSLQALPPTPTPEQIEQQVQAAPEVLSARLEVARQQAIAELERRRATPDLTVGLGTQRNNELGRHQALIGVSMALPLFDRNGGKLDEARAKAEQARDELSATVLRVGSEAQIAWSQLDSSRQQAELIDRDLLPQALRTHEATTTGFLLGKFGFLDVLDAQRTLFQARLQKLRALADGRRFAAELERLLGVPLDTLAASPNPSTLQAAP